MAEQQATATSEAYAPWESSDWNQGESFLAGVAQEAAPVSANPWEQDWGAGVSYLGNGMPEKSTNFGNRSPRTSPDGMFERVFRNLVMQESRGRHTTGGKLTESPVGAQGITQVMPKTGKNPGFGVAPIQNDSEEEFIRFGRDYLSAMLQEFDGDYEKALAAYNAGHGSVKRAVAKGGSQWKDFLPKRSETVPYIANIMKGIYNG